MKYYMLECLNASLWNIATWTTSLVVLFPGTQLNLPSQICTRDAPGRSRTPILLIRTWTPLFPLSPDIHLVSCEITNPVRSDNKSVNGEELSNHSDDENRSWSAMLLHFFAWSRHLIFTSPVSEQMPQRDFSNPGINSFTMIPIHPNRRPPDHTSPLPEHPLPLLRPPELF